MELDTQIEAILFWKGESLSIAELARMLKVSSGDIKHGLATFQEKLANRGLALVRTDNEVALVTAPASSLVIERLQKEELSKDLGKAAAETLSIILYRAPVSRRDIEYIRGVNSTSILRTLLIRGLIERDQEKTDERIFIYQPTISLLSLLGVRNREELPEYELIKKELDHIKEDKENLADTEDEKEIQPIEP